MTNPVIQVQYDDLEQISRVFLQQVDELEKVRRQITVCMDFLQRGGWQGRGSDGFFEEMYHDVLPGLRRMIDGMETGSYTTREIMNLLAVAEEEAAAAFQVTVVTR